MTAIRFRYQEFRVKLFCCYCILLKKQNKKLTLEPASRKQGRFKSCHMPNWYRFSFNYIYTLINNLYMSFTITTNQRNSLIYIIVFCHFPSTQVPYATFDSSNFVMNWSDKMYLNAITITHSICNYRVYTSTSEGSSPHGQLTRSSISDNT